MTEAEITDATNSTKQQASRKITKLSVFFSFVSHLFSVYLGDTPLSLCFWWTAMNDPAQINFISTKPMKAFCLTSLFYGPVTMESE